MGIFHACLAQAFLALVSFIALGTSRWWFTLGSEPGATPRETRALGNLLVLAHLIFLQLALGATMRHAHAGLSIPDFPKAYGHWWPQIHQADLPALNLARDAEGHAADDPRADSPANDPPAQRLLILALTMTAAVSWRPARDVGCRTLRRLATAGVGFIALQTTLGIYTIWTNKAADVATAHVAVGAMSFVWAVLTYAAWRRWTLRRAANRPPPSSRRWRSAAADETRHDHRIDEATPGRTASGPATATPGRRRTRLAHPPGLFGDLCELVKARLTSLVLVTTLAGFYMGWRGPMDCAAMFHTLFGTALVAAGAAALNQLIERAPTARCTAPATGRCPRGECARTRRCLLASRWR